MSRFIDISGEKYNRWTVLSLDRIENKKAYWLCKCDCGVEKVVSSASLRNNTSKSCGCILNENRSRSAKGLSKTRINNIYHNMKTRCNNKKSRRYKNYGGRGIKVCDEWNNNFLAFYNWSINNGYKDNLTIDRIDVNGDYEPSNCRWVTLKEQFYNKTDNVFYEINGEKKCLAELCKDYNMPYQTVRKRLERGKSIEESLNTPINKKYRNKLLKKKG